MTQARVEPASFAAEGIVYVVRQAVAGASERPTSGPNFMAEYQQQCRDVAYCLDAPELLPAGSCRNFGGNQRGEAHTARP